MQKRRARERRASAGERRASVGERRAGAEERTSAQGTESREGKSKRRI